MHFLKSAKICEWLLYDKKIKWLRKNNEISTTNLYANIICKNKENVSDGKYEGYVHLIKIPLTF
jgi:hypothetical protein